MKKFMLFLFVILAFSCALLYMTERLDALNLKATPLDASLSEQDGELSMSWEPLPYPCRYKVEAVTKATGILQRGAREHILYTAFTRDGRVSVPSLPIPSEYRVAAYGLFGKIKESLPLKNPYYPDYPKLPSPVPVFHYDEKNPASLMPYLVWHSVPGAVSYELELLSSPPDEEGGVKMARRGHLFSTQAIYTNGYQANLTEWQRRGRVFWRVRALDLSKKPIGIFSDSEEIVVDTSLKPPDYPLVNTFSGFPESQSLLYPVYQWIPMNGASRYEVELMPGTEKPPRGKEPSENRAWHAMVSDAFSCYDEYARPYAGEYYWRVRAVDERGETFGEYSDAAEFVVKEEKERPFAAAFGDSISHGGGAVSYSPANLEYSYVTYLDFPALNLSRSGDTAHTTLLRFDEDVLRYRPRNLMILTGSNDIRAQTGAEEIISDLDELRKKCEANDIRPIFLTLMPVNPENIQRAFRAPTDERWKQKLEKVNAFIRRQEHYIDLEPYFYDAAHTVMDTSLCIDGLHPDIRGKMLMAEIINANRSEFIGDVK